MRQFQKISIIGMIALVVGIITLVPVMGEEEDDKKVNLCHYSKEDKKFSRLHIPLKAAKSHEVNHFADVILAPESDDCPKYEIAEEGSPNDLITRAETVQLKPGDSFNKDYFCDKGEIILGGIGIPSISMSTIFGNVNHRDQAFTVNMWNDLEESVSVNVIYVCLKPIS